MFFTRKRNRRAERLTREVSALKHDVKKLEREVDVRDVELKAFAEVVERNRARVLAETSEHVKKQARNTVGEIDV